MTLVAAPSQIREFSVRTSPWDELAHNVKGARTVAEALDAAGLNFEVLKRPALFNYGTEETPLLRTVPGQYVTYRSDTHEGLGVVGKRYTIMQNLSALDFFDAVVERSEAIITNAISLRGGATCVLQAEMPANIHVPGDGNMKVYVTLILNHDGTGSTKALLTPVRIFCMNTMLAATKQATNQLTIVHSASGPEKLRNAMAVLEVYDQYGKEMSEIFTRMCDHKLSESQLDAYIGSVFPSQGKEREDGPATRTQNRWDLIREYTLSNVGGQQTHPGSLYQAFNGVTGYFQNVKEYKETRGKQTQTRDEGRLVQGLLGDDGRTIERAFQLALAHLN